MSKEVSLESFINSLYYADDYAEEGFFENVKETAKELKKTIKRLWEQFVYKFKRFLIEINPFLSREEKVIRVSKEMFKGLKNAESEVVKLSENDLVLNPVMEAYNGIDNDALERVQNISNEISRVINESIEQHKKTEEEINSIANQPVQKNTVKIKISEFGKIYKNMAKAMIKTNKIISRAFKESGQKEGALRFILRYVKLFISLVTLPCKVFKFIIQNNKS